MGGGAEEVGAALWQFPLPATCGEKVASSGSCEPGEGQTSSCVLAAINFDDEVSLPAYEVDNERSNRLLTNELESAETSITQCEPQFAFRIGLIAAELSLNSDLSAVGTAHGHLPLTRLASLGTLSPFDGEREKDAPAEVPNHAPVALSRSPS